MNSPHRELLAACDLSLRYGRDKPALDRVSFALQAGDALAVVGPSGCGKSSLLAVLGGLQRPSQGRLLFRGRDVYQGGGADLDSYRATAVGFVFQQPCLLPHLSLLDNVLVAVDHLHAQADRWRERARMLMDTVGVGALASRRPHEVSGGQAQRAAIARALLRGPGLILADEPTGALDDDSASQVMELLLTLRAEGACLVVVTHDRDIAARLPSRLALEAGRVVEAPAAALLDLA